nr:uncharacterized protein LOC124807267 isoform X2 [Hydra vulgaris]
MKMEAKFKKFAVVEFLDEKKSMCAMDVICLSWLINKSLVRWPNHLRSFRLLTAIREVTLTPVSNWKQLKIRVLYYSAKKLAVCNTIDTEETYPSVSPRLKKSFNCQNILQPTTVQYIELFSSNRSLLIFSSSDQSLEAVVAALGT